LHAITLNHARDATLPPHAAHRTPIGCILDRQLCFALYSASLAMTKLYKRCFDPLGLDLPAIPGDAWCCGEADGPAVSQLGERLALDFGTLDAAAQAPGGRSSLVQPPARCRRRAPRAACSSRRPAVH
jgi:hypothetical protein